MRRTSASFVGKGWTEPTPIRSRQAEVFASTGGLFRGHGFGLADERGQCGWLGADVELVGIPFRVLRRIFRDVSAMCAAPVQKCHRGVRLEGHHLYEIALDPLRLRVEGAGPVD